MSLITAPREIHLQIFGLLSCADLVRLSETCSALKVAARDPALWRRLTLTYKRIKEKTKACRDHVRRCSELKELNIIPGDIVIPWWTIAASENEERRTDMIMSVATQAKKTLTSFIISPILPPLNSNSIYDISKMTRLEKLAFGVGEQINISSDIVYLANLKDLRSLKISGLGLGLYQEGIMPGKLEDLFSKLKKLEEVEIKSHRALSDKVIESLVTNNPNLRHLDISTYDEVFSNYPTDPTLTSRSIIMIADKCPNLTYIDIGHLEMFTKIDILYLVSNCSRLKYANFERTKIGDDSLRMLAHNCSDLEEMNLSGCEEITYGGIKFFLNGAANFKLKHLDISDCEIYQAYMRKIVRDHPSIEIVINDDYESIEIVISDSDDYESSDDEYSSDE